MIRCQTDVLSHHAQELRTHKSSTADIIAQLVMQQQACSQGPAKVTSCDAPVVECPSISVVVFDLFATHAEAAACFVGTCMTRQPI